MPHQDAFTAQDDPFDVDVGDDEDDEAEGDEDEDDDEEEEGGWQVGQVGGWLDFVRLNSL